MAQTKKAQVIITANASVAKRVMEELDGAAKRVANEMQRLADEGVQIKNRMSQLAAEGRKDTDEFKRLQQQMKENTKAFKDAEKEFQAYNSAIRENVKDTKRVEEVMKNLSGTATRDLRRALQAAKREMEGLAATDPKLQKLRASMKAIQAQIDANTGSLKKQGTTLGTTLKNLVAYAGVFAGFNKIKSMIEGVFQANLKLSDSLANIRKVSGLTMKDINQLYGNITKIDTRNTIETLNELAYTGAKLGIAEHGGTQALTGFVKAAEQVQMALGEDLGDEALPALAKLTEVMGLMDRYGVEQAMQKAASSIFQLGATSTATGKNIVEFSKRLMGLANVSRISADELLAIGSAADAMGLMPEVAATAFNKLFTAVQQKHNLIEKTLDLPKGRINYWFEQGKTMNAIVEIFDAMNKRGNMNALDGVFKDLGSDGARLVAVMTTMADRVDILRDHLKTSTKAFKEGEAVIAEYMIQNETAAALMDRASNLWAKAFTNPEGVTMVQTLAKEWYNLSKEMTNNQATMLSLKSTIEAVALALRTVISLAPFLIKAFAWAGVLATIRGVAFGIGGLITQLRAATGAAMTLQVALKSNWVLAGVSAVAAGMTLLVEKMQAATQAAEAAREREAELDRQRAQSKDTIEQSVRPLERYKASLDKANYSEEQRNKLLREYLAGNYQDYLDYLGIEIDKTLDLAQAYNMVVKTMKQKKAYEERESYRTEVNGTNRMDRIAAGMEFEREAKRVGLEGVDRKWIEQNQARNTMDIYMRLMRQRYGQDVQMFNYDNLKDVTKVRHSKRGALGTTRLYGDDLGDVDLWNAIVHFQNSYRKERNLNRDVDDMFKDMVGDYDPDAWDKAILESQLKRKGGLTKEKPDKGALAAARKAQQEEKQALRKDLQDAQRESDAIIAKIEEWYRLQETVITDMQTDGKLTKEQADQAVRTLNIAKNTALRDARLAISGRDTKAWETTKQQIGNLMLDQGQWSQELLQQILGVSMENIRKNLSRIDKGGGQYGITTSSLKDAVDKNAAGNQREIARLQARSQQEVEKILMEYDYIDQAMRAFSDRLAQMGILTETARQMAERLSDVENYDQTLFSMEDYEAILANNEQAKRDMLQAFIASGSTPYAVNPEDKEQLRSWFMEFVGQFVKNDKVFGGLEYKYQSWAKPFQADFELWRTNSDQYKAQIQAFYFSLMKSEQNYYENRKKQREQDQRSADTRWQAYGWTAQQEQEDMQYERDASLRKIHGEGQNFGQTYGFSDTIADDPEIKRIQNRMVWRQRELDDLVAKNASEEVIMQKQNEMLQEAANLAEKVSQEVANRIAKVQTLSEPLNAFGEEVGQKLGEMWQGISQEGKLTFGQMARNMGIEYAKLTIKMVSENMQKKLQQGLFYKQMEMQEMQHQVQLFNIQQAGAAARATGQLAAGATLQGIQAAQNAAEIGSEGTKAGVMTMFGISEGASKTIAKLGYWGIPLIGVITSILMGLLNSAKATASQSTGTAASSSSATKMKLVSSMLTYDEGNTYAGTDGHVYRATPQPALPEGVQLIRRPIATTVNGQPSLVAERGPEIIIGRRATRHIRMNEPGLLHHLAAINGRYRTYDQGTVPAGSPDGAPSLSGRAGGEADARIAAALDQNTQMMAAFVQMMNTIQQRGIPAHIQKYGSGGLIDEVQSGLKFANRYK